MPVEQLIEAQATRTARLQARVKELVAVAWAALPGVDDAALDQWLTTALPVVAGAEATAAADMAAYLALMVAEMTGQPPRYIGVPSEVVTGARLRRGTPPEVAYSRPMIQARSLLAQKLPYAETMQGAGRRAELLAATDVQSARLYASQAVLSADPRVQGFRRTLTGPKSCGLCVVASTRRYHKEHLSPRHPGCDCGVVPIVGDHDPGEVLNRQLLESMHANIEETFGPDAVTRGADTEAYRQLVEVYDHGEYGPTLVRRGDHVLTSASASARPTPAVRVDLSAQSTVGAMTPTKTPEKRTVVAGQVRLGMKMSNGLTVVEIVRPAPTMVKQSYGRLWIQFDNGQGFQYPLDHRFSLDPHDTNPLDRTMDKWAGRWWKIN